MDYKFNQGDVVFWDPQTSGYPFGSGTVQGCLTVVIPMVIVKVANDRASDTYPFSCTIIPQHFLSRFESLQDDQDYQDWVTERNNEMYLDFDIVD